MFNPFKKKKVRLPTAEELSDQAKDAVCEAIDTINANMGLLSKWSRPWMDWTTLPPRLKLVKRTGTGDLVVLHPEED